MEAETNKAIKSLIDTVALLNAGLEMSRKNQEKMLELVTVIVSVLTVEQQQALREKIKLNAAARAMYSVLKNNNNL